MKTNVEWEEWGRRDPLYGVATWPGKARGGPDPWTDADFYSAGEADWEDFFRHWMRFGVVPGTCLEIGCGAGRITRWIATSFDRVTAVDVSRDMIKYATAHVPPNVEFHVVESTTLPVPDKSVDGVFSVLVFQHFEDPRDAEAYLRDVVRVLSPGGTLMIQFPTYQWPGHFAGYRAIYRIRRWAARVRADFRRRYLRWARGPLFFRYLRFETAWIERTLTGLRLEDIELVHFRPRSHPEWLTFAFARKPEDTATRKERSTP